MVDIAPLPPDQNPAPAPVPPPYQPPAPEANPYDFITNPATLPAGPPKKQRIIVVAVLFLILLMVGVILAAVLSSSGGGPKDAYLKVLQKQAQLIHVSELGEKSARSTPTKNLAVTARFSLSDTRTSLTALAKKAGAPTDSASINAGLNKDIDNRLAQATLNNRFDEEFTKTLNELLPLYQQDLKAIYDQTSDTNDKKTLQQAYNNAQQLITDDKAEEDEEKKETTETP